MILHFIFLAFFWFVWTGFNAFQLLSTSMIAKKYGILIEKRVIRKYQRNARPVCQQDGKIIEPILHKKHDKNMF